MSASLGSEPALIADARDDRLDLRDTPVYDLQSQEHLRRAGVFLERRQRGGCAALRVEQVIAVGEGVARRLPETFAKRKHSPVLRVLDAVRYGQSREVACRERREIVVDEAFETTAIARAVLCRCLE
jgi:hypothetical protein